MITTSASKSLRRCRQVVGLDWESFASSSSLPLCLCCEGIAVLVFIVAQRGQHSNGNREGFHVNMPPVSWPVAGWRQALNLSVSFGGPARKLCRSHPGSRTCFTTRSRPAFCFRDTFSFLADRINSPNIFCMNGTTPTRFPEGPSPHSR